VGVIFNQEGGGREPSGLRLYKEVRQMKIELDNRESSALRHALDVYLSGLRTEILKTDNRNWKKNLHDEEDLLKDIVKRMN
jgi:hypothetical protein